MIKSAAYRLILISPVLKLSDRMKELLADKNGLHWDALDEDISVAGLLAGQPDLSRSGTHQPV